MSSATVDAMSGNIRALQGSTATPNAQDSAQKESGLILLDSHPTQSASFVPPESTALILVALPMRSATADVPPVNIRTLLDSTATTNAVTAREENGAM
jgi:hypothetical protein